MEQHTIFYLAMSHGVCPTVPKCPERHMVVHQFMKTYYVFLRDVSQKALNTLWDRACDTWGTTVWDTTRDTTGQRMKHSHPKNAPQKTQYLPRFYPPCVVRTTSIYRLFLLHGNNAFTCFTPVDDADHPGLSSVLSCFFLCYLPLRQSAVPLRFTFQRVERSRHERLVLYSLCPGL